MVFHIMQITDHQQQISGLLAICRSSPSMVLQRIKRRRPNRSPLSVLLFPALDRVLQTGQTRRAWPLFFLMLDQPLHHGSVTAHPAEQIVEQRSLPQCAREQLFCDMRFPADLPQERFNHERELALRSRRRILIQIDLWKRIYQVCAAVRALQQPVINIGAAIAAFGLILSRWGSDAGGHAACS